MARSIILSHLLTENYETPLERSHHLVTLSAKTKGALQKLAVSYSSALAETSDSLANIGFTTLTRRSHFQNRLAIVAESIEDLQQQLGEFAHSSDRDGFLYQEMPVQPEPSPIAFLFTGQGAQYANMGKVLYETQPTFRRLLNRCDEVLQEYLELPLLSVLYPENADSPHLHQTAYTQPALFALEYALAQLWQSYGIIPNAVMGHSVGEYTAACIAGVFSLEDGLRLIAERGRLIQSLPQNGMMAAAFASEAHIASLIEPYKEQVAIATINGVSNVVISGKKDKMEEVLDILVAQGIQFRQLQVSHAFHSPLMEPILDSFEAFANTLSFQAPNRPLLSNVTGQFWKTGEVPDAAYWVRHLQEAVRFSDGMEKLAQEGYRIFMEMGPNSTLLSMGKRCLCDPSALWLPSLKRGQPDWIPLLNSLGQLYQQGVDIDWLKFDQDYQRRPVPLPNYPFDRQRYWESVKVPVPQSKSNPSGQTSQPELLRVTQCQDSWFYQWQWQAEPLSAPQDLSSGAILVLGDPKIWREDLAKHISENSHTLYWAIPGQSFSLSDDRFTLNPANPQDYEQLITAIKSDLQPIVAVIHLWNGLKYPQDSPEISETILAESAYSVLFLGQALLKHCPKQSIAFVLLTLSNYAVSPNYPIQGIHQIIGATLTQVLDRENPTLKTKVVDVVPEILSSGLVGQILWQELRTSPTGEGIIAIRGEQRLGRTLGPISAVSKKPIEEVLRDGDTYLITGGTSAVASEITMELVRHASLNLVLTGRQSLPPKEQWNQLLADRHPQSGRIKLIQQLGELGATVLYEAVDVTDEGGMGHLIDKIRDRFGRLDGVIHVAGVQDQKNFKLPQKSWQTVASVLAPKLQGTLILDNLTRSDPLKFFVMISSASASKAEWGANLSDYAAANAFLDNYAIYRSQQSVSGRSLAINFTPWQNQGMAKITGEDTLALVARALGINLLEPKQAVNSFIHTLTTSTPAVTHIIDFLQSSPQTTAFSSSSSTKDVSPSSLPTTQVTHLEDLVKEILSEHIKLSINQIEGHQSFSELGLDSLAGIEVIEKLNQSLNTQLSPTILFEYQSIDALVKYLQQNQRGSTPQLGVAEITSDKTRQITEKPEKPIVNDIAIIGMACKVPGANNLEEYWNLLSHGHSAIGSVPSSRWSTKDYFDPTKQTSYKTYCHQGGFIENPYDFDPLFFGISPKEAMAMDPQQRLFLQLAWQALFRSGYGSKNRPQDIGVFVGCGQNNYVEHFINYQSYGALCQRLEISEWFNQLPEQNRQALQDTLIEILQPSEILSETAAGNELNQIAARISHCLDFTGPSLSVSTACSSSLVALHLACDSLRSKQSSMAIVGGVNLNLSPTPLTFLSRVQALSETATCYPFDSRANGMVIGEGAGVVLLKPLQQAIADGDYIHAVIKGSAVNNDGHSPGITAPNPQGQARAIRQAYQRACIDPKSISYIEAHGTGTLLGDAIEIEGMTQAFGTFTDRRQFCGVGSVKSSIGHALSASGIISLIKVVLSMEHQQIPGTKGYQNPNSNIDFAQTPFFVVGEQGMSWSNQEHPLRAGVNGFGFGGTNAHIIVEQAPMLSPSPTITDVDSSHLLCLTFRNIGVLKKMAQKLREHLIAHPEQEIAEVCFTMNHAQKEFSSKAAFVVKDRQQLLNYLEAITNESQPSNVYVGQANPKRSTPLSLILEGTNDLSIKDVTTIGKRFPVWQSAYKECQDLWESFINSPQSAAKVHDFATQYAYLSWLKSLDIKPKNLLVAGIGILVGSCFTGLLTLKEALAALARLEAEKLVIPIKTAPTEAKKSLSWLCPLVTPKGTFDSTTQVSSLQLSTFVELGGSLNLDQETKKSETIYLYLGNSSEFAERLNKDYLSLIGHRSSVGVSVIESLLTQLAQLYTLGVTFRYSGLFTAGTRRVPLFSYPFDNKPYQAAVVKSEFPDNTNQTEAQAIHLMTPPLSALGLQKMDTVPILSSEQRQQSYLILTKALGLK